MEQTIISESLFIVIGFFITAAATAKHGMAGTVTGEHLGWALHQPIFLRWRLDNFVLKLPLHVGGEVFMVLFPLSDTPSWSF